MEYFIRFHILLLISLTMDQMVTGLKSFKERDKIELRRELDKITQDLLVNKDPFYHSYVFNSGVGNREKLSVEWMRQDPLLAAGEAVIGWQAKSNRGQVHLLGRKHSSITLVTAPTQLSANRSLQFQQHSLSYAANVTSTSLFTRWNPESSQPEVVVVVALDTSTAGICNTMVPL
ncbi:uncharacterized protein LOC128985200 [Macrosteles quadrilineatus]|uniref:uncharacterized protein LOC128985200 n=1 Tax=Macrosteles quadrilineatus TaxID=74068 RepID=UPI0023E15F12|nr:uncharacterized protein LOC128985200 [Macrosteles quadrilineatus]